MRNAAPPGEGPHIQLGLKKGYLRETNGHILYVACGKKYKAADPEESVRAAFYVQLIEKYQYPPERIDVEVEVPRRTPSDYADIVVYSDDQSKSPFIVVECKREGLSHKETNQGIEQAFGNVNSVKNFSNAMTLFGRGASAIPLRPLTRCRSSCSARCRTSGSRRWEKRTGFRSEVTKPRLSSHGALRRFTKTQERRSRMSL